MCFNDDLAANLFLYFTKQLAHSTGLMEGLSEEVTFWGLVQTL